MGRFDSTITALETQLEKLKKTREEVQMGVNYHSHREAIAKPNVDAWLKNANEVTTDLMGMIDMFKVKEGSLTRWLFFPNLKLLFSLNKKAKKIIKTVGDLQADGISYITPPSYSTPLACLEDISNGDFMAFESRRLIMEEIIQALVHDDINLIGVCGMGGMGKTTLVNEVAKRVKEHNLVDEVAMVIVGQEPSLTRVQAHILDMLGLKNHPDMESPITRPALLHRRLLKSNKKFLVILDDVWTEFDLQAMGIPLKSTDKNFKMLYTSRAQGLWCDLQTKKEITLELLSNVEAWLLFKEKAGNLADDEDLQPKVKEIVNKCGRLPLALVLIGALLGTSGGNEVKEIWKDMLDRRTHASSTLGDEQLFSILEINYKYLQHEEAHLFLVCCLFEQDEDIHLEDLARYGFGVSLFDGMNRVRDVRHRVFLIVDYLKGLYLLLASKEEEIVKVHDVVRNIGISIAEKHRSALVFQGAISQWPKTAAHEHYTAISVISKEIKELHEEFTYPNLEFLTIRCQKLEKLPLNIFEGMRKLKVLDLHGFCGMLTLQSLSNLTTLSLEGFCGTLDNTSLVRGAPNLKILNFRNSKIKELPEEIGELVNLRLLDMSETHWLTRIPAGVISRLVCLEELYLWGSNFISWEGEGKEEEVRNANLREFLFLSNLNTLEIRIRSDVLIPQVPIFSNLERYKVIISSSLEGIEDEEFDFIKKCKRVLVVKSSIPIPSNSGGIDSLSRSRDFLILEGEGCIDMEQEMSGGLVDAPSFGRLTYMRVQNFGRLEEVFRMEHQEDIHVATDRLLFPNLEVLKLVELPSLVGFCKAIDKIDFPRLKKLCLKDIPRVNLLFHDNNNLSSNADGNNSFSSLSLFPQKILLPNLEVLDVDKLDSLKTLGHGSLLADSFSKLKEFSVRSCDTLLCAFPSLLLSMRELQELTVESCNSLEIVFDLEGLESNELNAEILPPLKFVKLYHLPMLNCISKRDIVGFKYIQTLKIRDCNRLGFIFAPTMMKSIPQLRKLKISSCDMLSRIVAEENGLGESSVDKVEFPHLKKLGLQDLPNLVSFFPLVNTGKAKSTDHIHSPIQTQPFFNGKVAFPSLNYLGLIGLDNVTDLWCSESPTSAFSELKKLEVRSCGSLRNVFHPSMAGKFFNLKELVINDCWKMEAAIDGEEERREIRIDEILFPYLIKLELHGLPHMRSFCNFTCPLEMPLLDEMDILDCRRMEAFSLGKVSCPNLSLLDISWNGDLNNAVQALQRVERDNMITCLQTLFPNPQRGRCICFRTVNLSEGPRGPVSLYSIPHDFFGDGGDDDDIESSNPDVEGLLECYKSTDFPTSSVLSSVGSSLFVVGGTQELNPFGPGKTTGKIYRFDETKPADGWPAVRMHTHRASPETVEMDGKLYVFGGGPYTPFAEMFDPHLIPWTSVQLPPAPHLPTNRRAHMVTAVAALEPSKRILVASADFNSVYNVADQVWEELDHKADFSYVKGQAAVLRKSTILCWFSKKVEVHAYDLVLKRWFKSPIERLDKVHMREPEPDEPRIYCPLFPLDDNHLLWIWEELMGYKGTILPLVHCTKIRVSINTDAEGESRFSAAAVVSRSYALLGPDERILDAHVFLGEDDKHGERSSRLGGHDHGGRTWGHCGYRGGGRIVSRIAPFKICKMCSLPGHTERDCKGVPCALCGATGHVAKDCRSNGNWFGQSSKQ